MSTSSIFIFFAGVVLLAITVLRFTRRRLQNSKSYSDYVKSVKLKSQAEDEFGRNVRWVINERRDAGQDPGRTEPPAETGR